MGLQGPNTINIIVKNPITGVLGPSGIGCILTRRAKDRQGLEASNHKAGSWRKQMKNSNWVILGFCWGYIGVMLGYRARLGEDSS